MKAIHPDFTFVYADAEFTPDDRSTGGLISLALHSGQGSLYVVNSGADRERFCANNFCREHIWSKLPLRADGSLDETSDSVMHYGAIRQMVSGYFQKLTQGQGYRDRVGLIADHGTQDMQRIHDLFGNDFGAMPQWIPRRPFQDLATLEDLAGARGGRLPDGERIPAMEPADRHHALKDAEWDRAVHEYLMSHSRAVRVASGVERLEN